VIGPNADMQGQTKDRSGRAQEISQQAGMVQLGPVFDAARYWQKRVMRAVWNRVRQFWTDEMWIRVTDDEKTYFVALNRQITRGELEAERLKDAPITDQEKIAKLQQIAADPAMRQPVVQNNVAKMDMDIIIDEAPDLISLQQEQFGLLVELGKGGIPIPPKTLIQASTLRNKETLIDDMEANAAQSMPPAMQKQIETAQKEIEQKGKQVEQEQQQLKDLSMSIKEQISALKVERAELGADRKIFAAEQRVAQATMKAAAVGVEASIQTKATQASTQLAGKEAQLANRETKFSTKQAQANAQQKAATKKSANR